MKRSSRHFHGVSNDLSIDPAEVRRIGHVLFRCARRKVGSDELARELVQDTWLSGLKALPQFAGRSSLSTWFVSILRRRIADYYRAPRRAMLSFEQPAHLDSEAPERTLSANSGRNALDDAITRERMQRVLHAIQHLTPRQREAVELCGLSHLNGAAAAESMGVDPASLRVMLCRGRRNLRLLAAS